MTRAQKIVTRIFNLTSNRLRIRSVSSVKGDSRLIACCGSIGTLSNIQEQERGAQIAERSTRNGERWAAHVEQGIGNGELGMTVLYSDPFSVLCYVVIRHFKLLCGLPLYFRSQFLFLVSRSPFLILITSISCWPKFKLLFVFQCLYRCVITFYFIIYADVKWTVSERLD